MRGWRERLVIAAAIVALLLVYGLVEPAKRSDFSETIMEQSKQRELVKPTKPDEWKRLYDWGNQFAPPKRITRTMLAR